MSNWHAVPIDEVSRELKTDRYEGLSAEEAQSRLNRYGHNELEGVKGKEQRRSFAWTLRGIFFMILSLAVLFSIVMEIVFDVSLLPYIPK